MENLIREEQEVLEEVIRHNCFLKHGNRSIPENPWFIRLNHHQKSRIILVEMVCKSNKNPSVFAECMSRFLISQKEEEERLSSSKASALYENVEIRRVLNSIQDTPDIPTEVTIQALELETSKGKVIGYFTYRELEYVLEEGKEVTFEADLKEFIDLEFKFETSGSSYGNRVINFESALYETHFLSVVEKSNCSCPIQHKIGVSLRLNVELSRENKIDILEERLAESEQSVFSFEEPEKLYEPLLEALGIEEVKSGYTSILKHSGNTDSEAFCNSCLLI